MPGASGSDLVRQGVPPTFPDSDRAPQPIPWLIYRWRGRMLTPEPCVGIAPAEEAAPHPGWILAQIASKSISGES